MMDAWMGEWMGEMGPYLHEEGEGLGGVHDPRLGQPTPRHMHPLGLQLYTTHRHNTYINHMCGYYTCI
jgi:hypothetical protein